MKQVKLVASMKVIKTAIVTVEDNFTEEKKEILANTFLDDLKRNYNSIEEEILSVEVID